jgi:hypothetical protein
MLAWPHQQPGDTIALCFWDSDACAREQQDGEVFGFHGDASFRSRSVQQLELGVSRQAGLPVYLASMSNCGHFEHLCRVVDKIQDAETAYAR